MRKYDPASRFQYVESANMIPGVDFLTGGLTGPFIDTGRDVEFSEIGRIYLSISTVNEMAQNAGLFDHEDGDNAASFDSGYEKGYAAALEERDTIDELARDLADRLRSATARADRPAPVVERADEDEDAPLVFVTSGTPRSAAERGGDKATRGDDDASGQVDGTLVDHRSARFSVGPSDEPA